MRGRTTRTGNTKNAKDDEGHAVGLRGEERNGGWERWEGAGLFVLAVVAFLPAVGNGWIWDDDHHVTGNGTLRTAAGLWRIWFKPGATPQYYPLAFTVFWLEYQAFGLGAAGYHAVNVLLHGTNVVLLWRVLLRVGVPWRGAVVAAALWGVHPVQVETVDWVMELKNVGSTFLYLLSGRLLLKLWGFGGTLAVERWWRVYAGALGLFVMALSTKSVTASLPAAFLVVVWWRRGRLTAGDVGRMAPWFVIAVCSGLWTAHIEKTLVGAGGGQEWHLTAAQRVLIAGRAAAFYAGKVAWPWRLTFFYERWVVDSGVWWQWVFPGGVLGMMGVLFGLRGRIGRGPLAGMLFFVGTLFPALGFVDVYPFRYSFVADHFQYVACAGLLTVAGVGIGRLAGGKAWVVAGVVVAVLAGRSWARCFVYRDGFTLYADVVRQEEGSWVGHGLLASEYMNRKDAVAAAGEFAAATRAAPEITENYQGLAQTYVMRGQPEEAERRLLELLERAGLTGHQRCLILTDLGAVETGLGRREPAMGRYREAIGVFPAGAFLARYNLGKMLVEEGRTGEGEEQFRAAIGLAPERADAQFAMGMCLARENRVAESLAYFERAAELEPGWADARLMVERARGLLRR